MADDPLTHEGLARLRRREWLARSPAERLAWLEEAVTWAWHVGALDRDRARRQAEAGRRGAGAGPAQPPM